MYCSCTRAASIGGLVRVHRGGIGLGLGTQLATLLMGDDALCLQGRVATLLNSGILRLRFIVLHLADGFLKVRLKRPFVQLKQQLAFTHILSFFEEDFLDLAIDLGPDLHRLIRFNVADGLDLQRDILLLDTRHHHRRRGTACGGRGLAGAPGQ